MRNDMYNMWKYGFLIAITLTGLLKTDSLEIKRYNGQRFDTSLCDFNKVSNITKVYVGGPLTNKNNNITLEVNSSSLNDIYQETLDKCNGTSACHGSLYAVSNWQYRSKEGMVNITYQVIQYDCNLPDTGYSLNYVITSVSNYLTTPRCPLGRRIHVDDVFYKKVYSYAGYCVTDEPYTRRRIKEKCDGKFICDPFYINNIYISCPRIRSWDILTDYVVIQYHCIVSDNYLYQMTCSKYNWIINCPINTTNIIIKNIWIGFTASKNCNFTKTTCLQQLEEYTFTSIKNNCNGRPICRIEVNRNNIICPRNYKKINYFLVAYQCGSEFSKRRFCNNERISLNCSDGTAVHINSVVYGDYKYFYGCASLYDDKLELKQDAYCEKNVTLYNMTFYNEIISSCEGKMQCDDGLRAIAGPTIGPCYDNSMKLPDYVAVDYYCYPVTEVTSDDQPSTEAPSGVSTEEVSNTSSSPLPRKGNLNLTLYIVIPVVVLIIVMTSVITAVLIYRRRRKLAESQNESNQQTLQDYPDVQFDQTDSIRIGKKKETGQDSYTDPSSEPNVEGEPSTLYENAAFVEGKSMTQTKEKGIQELYAIGDKKRIKTFDTKGHPDVTGMIQKKNNKSQLATAYPEETATNEKYEEIKLYDTIKDKINNSGDDTFIIENESYASK